MNNGKLLQMRDVVSGYGQVRALKGISLKVEQGQIVTVVGPNGAGKSTTLRTIAGLLEATSGGIQFEGQSLAGMLPHQIVNAGISLIPEGRKIFDELTVEENMRIGAYGRRPRGDVKEDIGRMYELFPPLKGRGEQLGGTLSGGEQQMLAIARGLMRHPKLLMMDEPSLGLAPVIVDALFDIIEEINSQGTTVLLVEQNARLALSIGHYGYVMETGNIVLDGPCHELLQDEKVQRIYLGMA